MKIVEKALPPVVSAQRLMNEIKLKNDQIVFYNNYSCVGNFFYKVTSKKVFDKWSRRFFVCTNKDIHFFKYVNNKRKKIKTIYFTQFCSLGGLQCSKDKYGKTFYKFSLFYQIKENRKTYTFKSYNLDYAPELYKILNLHTYKKTWGKFTE